MNKLTPRQQDTLGFIKKFMLKNQVTPSVREIAKGLGINSIASVHVHMKALKDAGEIIPYGDDTIRYSVKGIKMVEEKKCGRTKRSGT